LPNIGNIINPFSTYISVTIQNKERKSNDQHAEFKSKKIENATSNLISLDDETELLKRKLEAEKA